MYNAMKIQLEKYDIFGKAVVGNLTLFKNDLILIPAFFIYKKLLLIYLNIYFLLKQPSV